MKHPAILVSVLMFSAIRLFAQGHVTIVSTVTPLDGGGGEIEIVNEADEAIAAFIVAAEGLGLSSGRKPTTVHYYDSVR